MFRNANVTPILKALWLSASLLLILFCVGAAAAQTSVFTYQGRLTDGGTVANGNYDLQFALWDSASGGTQIGATQTVSTVSVSAGIFSVQLDFGATAFPGANRFLEISARLTGTPSFTTLSPRQQITSTPYAIRSLNASSADTVTVNGVPGGSGNYIQNATTPQASANFNISGNGTAGGTLSADIVNATTQYNIGGDRLVSTGPPNLFNLFLGFRSGQNNTPGNPNPIFSGSSNSFFGTNAGAGNTSGFNNAFFGANAGGSNKGGTANAFFGTQTGNANDSGSDNSFFGSAAGGQNHSGSSDTLIGASAQVGLDNLTNATAVGARAEVDQSDSLVLGSIAGLNQATTSVNVGIGTAQPQARLHVKGDTLVETSGSGGNIQLGTPSGETGMTINKAGISRADMRFDGSTLKLVAIAGPGIPASTSGIAIATGGNVGIGTTTPVRRLDVNGMARVGVIPLQASTASVCINSSGDLLTCGASSLRWKTKVRPFLGGLDIVRLLRPINFNWKENGLPDIGLGAEDVAKVAPALTFVNSKGEAEGVKYDHLNIVLINAVKQQQDQIETLRAQNAALNARLRSVERTVRRRVGASRRRR